jgi:hypothetical protein
MEVAALHYGVQWFAERHPMSWADGVLPAEVTVLATSLYDDLAAELHEYASARLREHLLSESDREASEP